MEPKKSPFAELTKVKQQCSHYDDWRKEGTRCTKTTADDGLPYCESNGARYCQEHGPAHKYAQRVTL